MRYQLDDKAVDKAKQCIKKLKKKKKHWLNYLYLAERDLEKSPAKYYRNIKGRIAESNKEIAKIDDQIKEFKAVIKKRYIVI